MTSQIAKMPPRPLIKQAGQGELQLLIERQVDEDGIGMGVLLDGTPFLNQRGLALLCGVQNKYIGLISAEWHSEFPSDRTKLIKESVEAAGQDANVAACDARFGNVRVLAYPDHICMAILEHFAFEAHWAGKHTALANYKKLARHGLRKFIYDRLGYSTRQADDDVWKIFKDRVSLVNDAVPAGYFGVFRELGSVIVTLGLSGLHIDESFVPDISVGKAWANHWVSQNLSGEFGEPLTYAHNYPAYFPQAASNPQMAKCYPEGALGEFRRWFRMEYVGDGGF